MKKMKQSPVIVGMYSAISFVNLYSFLSRKIVLIKKISPVTPINKNKMPSTKESPLEDLLSWKQTNFLKITSGIVLKILSFIEKQVCPEKLLPTLGYKTYACKYLHLCPTLLPKFNGTHFNNLQYSICLIACVSGCQIICEVCHAVVLVCCK